MELAGKRVLVVDDDAKTVELVRLYLKRDGYRVFTAYDGIEALRLARESYPDLIVLDLMLPGIDGFGVKKDTLRKPLFQTEIGDRPRIVNPDPAYGACRKTDPSYHETIDGLAKQV